ncbi:MAG: zinc-binding dehydrogenase [Treponema sp.]|jgi:threonine dehydrogenase-like Zn-dependent dehydrogenase|nr:zinc-binding dehydrogenase [Treponema sp.]
MKSLVLGNKKAYVEDVPDPSPEKEWVIVKIESTPICGSDKTAFLSDTPVRNAGHEGSGIVVDSAGSVLLKNGDRVILNPLSGCGVCELCLTGNYIYCTSKPPFATHFAQFVKVQDFVCTVLPEDISYDTGAMACCALGPAFSSIKRMNLKAFDTLLVTGLGPVGMGAVCIAKFLGARVIALDTVPFRMKMALDVLGADIVLDAADPGARAKIAEAARPGRLTRAIDASGNAAAERLCIDAVEPGGIISFVGENHNEIPIRPSEDFIRKGLTLMGSWHCNLNDRAEMITLLRRSPLVPKLITETFGFSRVQEAFEKFMGGDTCKVMLKPWQ